MPEPSLSQQAYYDSPLGRLLVEDGELGLTKISLSSKKVKLPETQSKNIRDAFQALDHFFKGEDFTLPKLSWEICTPFQLKVLKQLLLIRPGNTMSYADLASKVNSPKAFRAVGSCMRFNPWPLLVPCHRIIPSSGGLGNYSLGGPSAKAHLLELEKQLRPSGN